MVDDEIPEISPDSLSVVTPLELRKFSGILANIVIAMTPDQLRTTLSRAERRAPPPKGGLRFLIPMQVWPDPIPEKLPIPVFPDVCPYRCLQGREGAMWCECDPVFPGPLGPPPSCHIRIEEDGSFSCAGSCSPFRLPCEMYYSETDCGLVIGCACGIQRFGRLAS